MADILNSDATIKQIRAYLNKRTTTVKSIKRQMIANGLSLNNKRVKKDIIDTVIDQIIAKREAAATAAADTSTTDDSLDTEQLFNSPIKKTPPKQASPTETQVETPDWLGTSPLNPRPTIREVMAGKTIPKTPPSVKQAMGGKRTPPSSIIGGRTPSTGGTNYSNQSTPDFQTPFTIPTKQNVNREERVKKRLFTDDSKKTNQQPNNSNLHSNTVNEIEQYRLTLQQQNRSFSGEQETLFKTLKGEPTMGQEELNRLKGQIMNPTSSINAQEEQTQEQQTATMNQDLGEQMKQDTKEEEKEEERHEEKVETIDAEKVLKGKSGIHFAQDIKTPTQLFKDGKKVIPRKVKDNKLDRVLILGDKDIDPTTENNSAQNKQKTVGRMVMDYTKSIFFRKSAKQPKPIGMRHSMY